MYNCFEQSCSLHLVILSPWRGSILLQRTWCLAELFWGIRAHLPLDVTVGTAEENEQIFEQLQDDPDPLLELVGVARFSESKVRIHYIIIIM
jgi:hypothetical protein